MSIVIPDYTIPFDGPIIFVGFGSVGRGLLPLIKRHITPHNGAITVIDPKDINRPIAEKYNATFLHFGLTKENYIEVLDSLLGDKTKRGFIVSVCNEVSSKALAEYAAKNNAFYIDTVVEPWPGFYFNSNLDKVSQSNYMLREDFQSLKQDFKNSQTSISCCGANPGMVSWFVKEALLNLAKDLGREISTPHTKDEWAKLMFDLGVKGIHIAEKDTQIGKYPRPRNQFLNTWSSEGCMAEVLQPAELGWGTHEKQMPKDGHEHTQGNKAAIYLDTPGGEVRVHTWTPTDGAHFGYLITHNEAISITDYFTLRDGDQVIFRPTCHYAYHPSGVAIESLNELFNERDKNPQTDIHILDEDEIVSGADELGVLLYGHERGAYWFGSRLTIEETRALAPHQNATGLQVTSATLAGIIYALKHPQEGIIETDDIDHQECLELQKPYLGKVFGVYTDWTPLGETGGVNAEDKWQFENIRITEPNNQ
ncbi:MAG: Homospermidine synthase [Parcubacteria group bacterium GW2011_GWF2_44_8]|nr:MAG: Homospermidine synthase [Parcubacteria group bacterium GW2011_GWF2_44_8]